MKKSNKKAKFWGALLAVWALVAVFFLGILDLEPQIRPVGNYEPSLIGQLIGIIIFLLLARKYLVVKGWW